MDVTARWALAAGGAVAAQIVFAAVLVGAADERSGALEVTGGTPPVTTVLRTTTSTSSTTTTSPPVRLPDVRGEDYFLARSRLLGLQRSLVIERVTFTATTRDEIGVVEAMNPEPGEAAEVGDTIELVVGVRPEPNFVYAPVVRFDVVDWADVSAVGTAGECASWRIVDDVGLELSPVACSEPHTFKVVSALTMPELNGEIDVLAINESSSPLCESASEEYLGVPLSVSSLSVYWVRPSVESWQQGDRSLVCMVFLPGGRDLVGSAKGTLW